MEKILNIKDKILAFLTEKGIKRTDFFEATGIQPSNFKGKNMSSQPGGDMIVKILTTYPDLSADWLLRDKGEMFINDSPSDMTDPLPQDEDIRGHSVSVGGNASNINNGTTEKTILIALTEVSEMRKLLAEVIYINKEQSQRLISIVDKIADRI